MSYIDHGVEAAIARLAARDDEIVTRSFLLDEGVARGAIDRRVRAGRLTVVYAGVYFAGRGEPSRRQRHRAAVLSCGPTAILADGTAAELWAMLSAGPGPPHVLHAGPKRRGPAGVHLRRTGLLPPAERTVHCDIPVTTPARTLLDLAAAGHAGLPIALDEAQALRLVTRAELDGLAASGRSGSTRLRALLSEAPGYTRQGAERLLRLLILKAQLPVPLFNPRVGGLVRDAVWPHHRLVLEVDGYATHGHRSAFERDRRRDQDLLATGYVTLRLTWRQLTTEPEAFVARLAAALALRAPAVA